MEEFKKKFILEAQDLINELEVSLLELEQNPEDNELIEKVFRSMHSLKGGGAMFGFTSISDLTHNLETIYDLIRNNERTLSNDIFNVTLKSVDHLKTIVSDGEQFDTVLHDELLAEIQSLVSSNVVVTTATIIGDTTKSTESKKTFFLEFYPNESIFHNGTNPLYLVEELSQLGDCISFPIIKKLQINTFNPELCITGWQSFIATTGDESEIHDVFIFVEDECELNIKLLSVENLLQPDVNAMIESHFKSFGLFEQEAVNEIVNSAMSLLDVETRSVAKKVKGLSKGSNSKSTTISSIRVASEKLDNLMNLVSELVTTQARLSLFAENKDDNELVSIAENIQKLTRELRDNAFSIVLIPIEHLVTRFHRLIRDLNNELDKQVRFQASGTETELDKTIIESLADPLMHILRNSMDHGIELPSERIKAGKPEEGTIKLKAFYSGTNVVIEISDDGKGIDSDAVHKKAIEKGLISHDQNLTDREIFDLIFTPGFSTAKVVSGVSGRGVGMDVVKRKIAEVRGEIEIDSKMGIGTTISIKLPLTLSIIDGLLIKLKEDFYILPLSVIDKIHAVSLKELNHTHNNVVAIDGEQIPYYLLQEELELSSPETDLLELIVVSFEAMKIGLVVDTVVGEYQAVIKPLGKHYKDQEIISGATILGDGTIALVLDTNKAIRKFSKDLQYTDEMG